MDKIFRCKLRERPANCEAAKPSKDNPGIWRRLREFTKKNPEIYDFIKFSKL